MPQALALITGASSGIGLACTERLLESGWSVLAGCRREPQILRTLADSHPGQLQVHRVDLASAEGCAELVASCPRPPQLLVHSAGIWEATPIASFDDQVCRRVLETNLFSALWLARETSRVMTRGSMVFIGSTAGQRGEPGYAAYAASKAGLWGLVQSLAQELAPRIRVNLVSPGWVRTPMAAATLDEPGRLTEICSVVPLGRIAEPEDIAAAVAFLGDPKAARHLTGIDLSLSGGALLPMPRG